MDEHTHGEDGSIIYTPPEVPEPIDPAPAVEAAAEADVEIARIQAETDIALGKEATKREAMWQESRVAELEGKLAGMEATLAALQPPAPEPVVVTADPPADPEPDVPPPPPDQPEEPPAKKSGGFWGPAYK